MAELVLLAKDVVVTLTKTDLAVGAPEFDEADILEVVHVSGVTATATQVQTVDAMTPTLWANAAEPSVANHIMFGYTAGVHQFKAKDALAAGDLLIATIKSKGERVKVT
ncbi:hypothetical protein ES707_00107 [subsurface metagenome]